MLRCHRYVISRDKGHVTLKLSFGSLADVVV